MAINSKARLFTPSVVRRLISSTAPVVSQTSAHLSGSSITNDNRSFKFDGPGTGLKSTQQLKVDWSKFENHTFFNSAEAKINVSFDTIINGYPFDGTKKELDDFFNKLTGFEKYIFDLFPKSVNSLNFSGGISGKYFLIHDTISTYKVWFNVDGSSIEPHVSNTIAVAVNIVSGDSTSVVALATKNAIDSLSSFIASANGSSVTIIVDSFEEVTNASAGTMGNNAKIQTVVEGNITHKEEIKVTFSDSIHYGNYVEIKDRAGALFPSLSTKQNEIVLDPGENSISLEMFLFIPSGVPRVYGDVEEYNRDQIVCQKLDSDGITGFTIGILDSRLKNRLIQETDSGGNLLWYVAGDPVSANEAGYIGVTENPPYTYLPEKTWATIKGYDPVLVEDKLGLTACDLFFLISSGSYHLSSSMEIPKGKWSHVCAVFDRTSGEHNVKLYLDGNLRSISTNSYEMNTFSSFGEDSFSLANLTIATGRPHSQGSWKNIVEDDWYSEDSGDSDSIPDSRYDLNTYEPSTQSINSFQPMQLFSGSLDELRIWHSARTPEVINNFIGRTAYADSYGNLKLYYKFNEAYGDYTSSDILLDSSGNSLHAKIENYHIVNRDISINKNPITGDLGDPDDTIASPVIFEKISDNPILFPSYVGVISLNKSLLDQAAWYDANNPNLITKLIPPHYMLESEALNGFLDSEINIYQSSSTKSLPGTGDISQPQLIQSILFTWARYFDEIKMFLDHFSNLLNVDYDAADTVPDNFLPFLANYYGIKLPNIFTEPGLEQYYDGENILPDKGVSEASLQFIQNQIWRRILININEMLQSKGTVHGIRALMLSAGISPDGLFRFREYGGSRTKTLKDVRRNRTEVASTLDFSGTLAGVFKYRPAPGAGNPFYYNTPSLSSVNPWEASTLDDEIDDYKKSPFITPFIMSPFLSGSRIEVGSCEPDTDIPVAYADITLDYSLPSDSSYGDVTPRYRESAGYLADSTILDEKVLRLTDIDGNKYTLQFKGKNSSKILENATAIDIVAIDDRIDIAQEIVNVINKSTTFIAYNASAQNNGIVRLYQPRGGRAGNYPIELLQLKNDVLVPWGGLIQAIDSSNNTLWKVPDVAGNISQGKDTEGNFLYTVDSGSTFTTDPISAFGVYQFPLSAVGYKTKIQVTVLNKEGTNQIGVWQHRATGKKITFEDHPDYGSTVFSDDDVGDPYDPVMIPQLESEYADLHGYVPVYNRKAYLEIDGFKAGDFGFINHDHPDLSTQESAFIKNRGSYHGFDLTATDGLFTSGSWTAEAIYRFEKPNLNFYPATQSLMRLHSTYGSDENHVILANLVCMRDPAFDQITENEIIITSGTIKLFVRPELSKGINPQELMLQVTGVNIVDGQNWNISYGRERSDAIGSVISSSYFLRVSKNSSGDISEYYEDKQFFLETLHEEGKTFWSDISIEDNKNNWGPFIVIGSQSIAPPESVGDLGLNSSNASNEKVCTIFAGKISQLRFWSKALTTTEFKEHVRNPFSLGVENPASNFNFASSPSGSWERLRLDISMDQQVTSSIQDELSDQAFRDAIDDSTQLKLKPLGWLELFDFSQAIVSGSRGALWRTESNNDEMKYHMYGYGFEAGVQNIKPLRFDYQTIDPKFDEQSVDNKIRIRSFQFAHNIEEYQAELAPVYEIMPGEIPSDDTRFSIDVSSYQALNDDMIKIFATLESLDNIIGSPEHLFTQSYPDLEFLREVYFRRLDGKVKISSFFEFFKWFDSSIGELIRTMIPRKTHFLGVNFVIESHMLERAKMTYNYSDVYLGHKNRHSLKGTPTLQLLTGQVKRF